MRLLFFITIIIIIISCAAKSVENSPGKQPVPAKKSYVAYEYSLEKLMDSLHLDKKKAFLFVDKSDYTLSFMVDTILVKQYPVVFGYNPVDDKLREGDRCTPEGTFKVKAFYPHKSWSKFIWFDYPNADSWKKHKKAIQDGLIPKNSRIGGDVGIHGVPADSDDAIDDRVNWTWGCVSLKRKDVDEIYKFAFVGMKVKIQP